MTKPVMKTCWLLRDPAIERDVLAFWREEQFLPSVADAAMRLKDICVVAYDGARIIAVLEARLRVLQMVRSRIAMLRLAVSPAMRQSRLATEMIPVGQRVLEQWSVENPQEKLMGTGCIVQTKVADQKLRQPVWPQSSLMVINYTQKGEQMRLAWFKHATLS